MVTLTFYGGVNEIGGNKVLVEDRGTRVFLDFGQSFTFGEEYFTGWLGPRAINGLGDYFEFGLLPKLPGVYARDQLAFTDLPYTEPTLDAVFLSHAHVDHVDHLAFLDPTIPVYLGAGTKRFLDAMEETPSRWSPSMWTTLSPRPTPSSSTPRRAPSRTRGTSAPTAPART